MKTTLTKHQLEIIEAYASGKDVIWKYKNYKHTLNICEDNEELTLISLLQCPEEFSLPKEPEYEPFTYDDSDMFMGKEIVSQDGKWKSIITFCDDLTNIHVGLYEINLSVLFSNYTFKDGSVCGKEKK